MHEANLLHGIFSWTQFSCYEPYGDGDGRFDSLDPDRTSAAHCKNLPGSTDYAAQCAKAHATGKLLHLIPSHRQTCASSEALPADTVSPHCAERFSIHVVGCGL